MSTVFQAGKKLGAAGVWLGAATAGAAVGFAAERYVMGRSLRRDDPYRAEPFGSLRGTPQTVVADDGARLYVEVDEPDGTPDLTVVFSHGYALTQDSWHFQRRDLRGSARLVFWDQRRHGRSAEIAEGETVAADERQAVLQGQRQQVVRERLAADLASVLDATAPTGPVVLVGHSMGGMTILALALERPEMFGERIRGAAFIATSADGGSGFRLGLPAPLGSLASRSVPGLVATLGRRPELVEHGRRAGSDLGYVLTRRYSFGSGASPALVEFTAAMNAATPVDVLAEFLPVVWGIDARDALPVLAGIPTLVIAAENDHLTPVEHGRAIAEALPQAEYVEVADCGHMVIFECHELVTEHVKTLIAQTRRGMPRSRGSRTKVRNLVGRR
ncbi:alpha/beta hydrolase [Actinobacteria bacterium YIM 96077]|uniref:Alpha/beta hydrolase n=1 Tax=Phytoactinopolyspora halophila TaxID=1981511 RepID=A0A329QGV2_9ACTN|nr:alpha/beta hydrolase [Phytoactinopolyspora halophila]AYY14695.1 alpha/beta hydrolase [Actinobacteria bacterium YIM 96077]RAW11594.1 alpha/beta hydrolase [Phytoactinopolyspora halophila]